MTMKPYLRVGLALVIVLGFLMASTLLSHEAASALIKQPKVKVDSAGVRANARIHRSPPPDNGIEKADEVAGEIKGKFSPGDSATAQFASSSLELLGTQLQETGAASNALSVIRTGPDSIRIDGRHILNNINSFDRAVTADRIETRLICDRDNIGKVTCPVQSVVFKNLKVNGVAMPDQPQPNTKVEFDKQITIGDFIAQLKVRVILRPTILKEDGGRAGAAQASFALRASGSILIGQTRVKRPGDHPGQNIIGTYRILPGTPARSFYASGASQMGRSKEAPYRWGLHPMNYLEGPGIGPDILSEYLVSGWPNHIHNFQNANGPQILLAIEAANHETFRAAIEQAINDAIGGS